MSERKSAKAQTRVNHPFVFPGPFIQTDALSELIRLKVRGLIADFLDEECELVRESLAWRTLPDGHPEVSATATTARAPS